MSDESKSPEDKPNFQIAKAALEAGKVMAEALGLEDLTQVVVVVKMQDEESQMNIGSLSTQDAQKHLHILTEGTQRFANQMGIPLEMIYLNQAEGGDES